MTLEERLQKVREEIEGWKEKDEKLKEKIAEKRKEERKILEEIEQERLRKELEKKQKIAEIVLENFGEIGEEDLRLFAETVRRNAQNLQNTKHQLAAQMTEQN